MSNEKDTTMTAAAMGRRGGSANSPAQQAARAKNSKSAGRPRRVCTACGEPVHGGHKKAKLNKTCHGRTWEWQKPSEKRAALAAKRAAKKTA
jgi:hypothetical protein